MPRFEYDRSDIHVRYDVARSLPADVLRGWMERIAQYVPGAESIVDLGCGTGRFSSALAEFFSATVRGVDPSGKMLGVATERTTHPSVEYLLGSAESIPIDDGWADLVFMSMAYHHLHDRQKALTEILRVLRPGGWFCVRTSTRERLRTYPWVSCFPEAMEIDMRRLPSADGLRETLEMSGFRPIGYEVVRQLFAIDAREYYEKIGMRAVSSLREISDEAFEQGMKRLARYCDSCDPGQPVHEEVELFIVRSEIGSVVDR